LGQAGRDCTQADAVAAKGVRKNPPKNINEASGGLLGWWQAIAPPYGVFFDLRYSLFLFDQIVIAVTDSASAVCKI
jgi:hypothetical protein